MIQTWKISPFNYKTGHITRSVVGDAGNIYCTTDGGLWKINTKMNTIHDLLPWQQRRSCELCGIVWDQNDTLYICDSQQKKIHKYSISSNSWSVFIANNTNSAKTTIYPFAIAIDKEGCYLYVGNFTTLCRISVSSKSVETVSHVFTNITGITLSDNGTIYVSDYNCVKQVLFAENIVSKVAGTHKFNRDGPFHMAQFTSVNGITWVGNDKLVVWDHSCRLLDLKTRMVSTISELNGLTVQSISVSSGVWYVCTPQSVLKYEPAWRYERLLWLAWMKEETTYCDLAKIPSDIIREIVRYLFGRPWS